MKIKSKLKLNKKSNGNLDDFLPILIFMMIASFILLLFIEVNVAINSKSKLNSIARQYTLKMETKGFLSEDDIKALVDHLNKNGFANADGSDLTVDSFKNAADYSGKSTNGVSVGYGNEVSLKFTVYSEQRLGYQEEEEEFLPFSLKKQFMPLTIEYHSTSKE